MQMSHYEFCVSKKIVDTLKGFGIKAEAISCTIGWLYTLYELKVASGTKVSSVLCLEDELEMALSDIAEEIIRIVAPIPGKSTIGIEIRNPLAINVCFDLIVPELEQSSGVIPIALGVDVYKKRHVKDLTWCPHLLIAGNPGTGKTLFINSLIHSIVLTRSSEDVKLVLIDTKKLLDPDRKEIPNLLFPIITDTKAALDFFDYLFEEKERRLELLNERGVRKISEYNHCISEDEPSNQKMPYLVVIVDEFSDLMLEEGKWFESMIEQIAPKGATVGIHLVFSTNRCTSDVITGVIKTQFTSQIAFAVSSSMNSRIVIDQVGAEKLLPLDRDFLYCDGVNAPLRLQGVDNIFKERWFTYK